MTLHLCERDMSSMFLSRNNPMRSGYKFVYQQAKLNLTLYFPEKIFNRMLEILNPERIEVLKAVVESSIPSAIRLSH